jgi:dienelactone hydrolase
MKLQIQPLVALADEKASISVSELPPFSKVKIGASLRLPWAESVLFESFAWFTADSSGNVDLSKQKPDSGSYDYIGSMGLIESVMSNDPHAIEKIGENISVNDSLFIDVVAECGQDKASAKLERLFKTKEVKSQGISDEFAGELFYTENPNNKTIVNLVGSSGDLAATFPMSALLASRGFNVLSVTYFRAKGLPLKLAEIPLEYFERIFTWLSKNPITRGKEIYVLGTSKGAELALLLASRYPFITRVAAFSPHAYCFEGLNFKNVSCWTYEGKPIPFILYKMRFFYYSMLSSFVRNQPFGYTYAFRKSMEAATNKEDARIKVENAQADIILFAGKQDNMWNSYDGCVEIMDQLKKHNYPHDYNFFCYEEAGHQSFAPYIIPASIIAVKKGPRLTFSMGGTLEANAYAQADSWEKAIEFFKK